MSKSKNLDEPTVASILNKDLAGYSLTTGYWLQLKCSCMGTFPALTAHDEEPFICLSKDLIQEVLTLLSPRRFEIKELAILVVPPGNFGFHLGVLLDYDKCGFPMDTDHPPQPIAIMTSQLFSQLKQAHPKPVKWAPGLVGDDMSPTEFQETLQAALAKCSKG